MRRSMTTMLAVLCTALCAALPIAVSAQAVTKANDRQAPAVQKAAPRPAGGGIIDINRATPAELEAIPGIGKAYAAKIVAGRPYSTKAGLVQKNILSAALYEKIKDRIVAKQ